MRSAKVLELLKWLNKSTRKIELPRNFSEDEIRDLVEIGELEQDKSAQLHKKVDAFKKQRK